MSDIHSSKRVSVKSGRSLSRRTFLGAGSAALAALFSGCYRPAATKIVPTTTEPLASTSQSAEPLAATATPLPATYTPVPAVPTSLPETPVAGTDPTLPAAPQASLDRASLMAHWPAIDASRVVLVRHEGVWVGDAPDPAIVLQMLDAGVSALTGVDDSLAVWRALFAPEERVLLKVNCIAYNGPTQPAVTYAVAQRLQDAGLVAENLLIFDRTDNELASAGYTLNDGGSGVQCRGRHGTGSEVALSQARVHVYEAFDAYDAIVNIPTPKQHSGAGISVSMKNHYGSVDQPSALHGNLCDPAIAELNAQPVIRDKTRLIVAAALNVSPRDWNQPERENALLFSFDPVALDTVGRDILVRHRQALGLGAGYLVDGARQLATAQTLQLGATDVDKIDLREVVLG